MYNNCKIKGKEHLLVDHKGVPITLNKWARQGWSNGGDMLEEQYTLISEEKVNHFLDGIFVNTLNTIMII